jgi:hypothetical protein
VCLQYSLLHPYSFPCARLSLFRAFRAPPIVTLALRPPGPHTHDMSRRLQVLMDEAEHEEIREAAAAPPPPPAARGPGAGAGREAEPPPNTKRPDHEKKKAPAVIKQRGLSQTQTGIACAGCAINERALRVCSQPGRRFAVKRCTRLHCSRRGRVCGCRWLNPCGVSCRRHRGC